MKIYNQLISIFYNSIEFFSGLFYISDIELLLICY